MYFQDAIVMITTSDAKVVNIICEYKLTKLNCVFNELKNENYLKEVEIYFTVPIQLPDYIYTK